MIKLEVDEVYKSYDKLLPADYIADIKITKITNNRVLWVVIKATKFSMERGYNGWSEKSDFIKQIKDGILKLKAPKYIKDWREKLNEQSC